MTNLARTGTYPTSIDRTGGFGRGAGKRVWNGCTQFFNALVWLLFAMWLCVRMYMQECA